MIGFVARVYQETSYFWTLQKQHHTIFSEAQDTRLPEVQLCCLILVRASRRLLVREQQYRFDLAVYMS